MPSLLNQTTDHNDQSTKPMAYHNSDQVYEPRFEPVMVTNVHSVSEYSRTKEDCIFVGTCFSVEGGMRCLVLMNEVRLSPSKGQSNESHLHPSR